MAVHHIDTPETRKPAKSRGLVTMKPVLGSEVMYEHDRYLIWSLGHAPGCFWITRSDQAGDTWLVHVHKSHLSNPPQQRLT